MPQGVWLHKFAELVQDYYGHECYHVGSSLHTKDWRDVDVRLILPDDEFTALFGDNEHAGTNRKLAAAVLAWSALAKAMTGLPVDFQIQSVTHANDRHPRSRSALISATSRPR